MHNVKIRSPNIFPFNISKTYNRCITAQQSLSLKIGRCIHVFNSLDAFCQMFYCHIYRFNMYLSDDKSHRSVNLWPNITSYPVCIEDGGGNGGKLGFG